MDPRLANRGETEQFAQHVFEIDDWNGKSLVIDCHLGSSYSDLIIEPGPAGDWENGQGKKKYLPGRALIVSNGHTSPNTYCFVSTSINAASIESDFSNMAVKTVN